MNIRYMKKVVNLLEEILNHQVANRSRKQDSFYRCYTYAHGEWPAWVKKAESLRKELHRNLITKQSVRKGKKPACRLFSVRWREHGRWRYSVNAFKSRERATQHVECLGDGEVILAKDNPELFWRRV